MSGKNIGEERKWDQFRKKWRMIKITVGIYNYNIFIANLVNYMC